MLHTTARMNPEITAKGRKPVQMTVHIYPTLFVQNVQNRQSYRDRKEINSCLEPGGMEGWEIGT